MTDSVIEWEGISNTSEDWQWDMATDLFTMTAETLIAHNEELNEGDTWWRVQGFPLWSGGRDGIFHADSPMKLLESITVRSDWSLRYTLDSETMILTCHLSHHDASGQFTVQATPNPDR
jgi:hypothetical protein